MLNIIAYSSYFGPKVFQMALNLLSKFMVGESSHSKRTFIVLAGSKEVPEKSSGLLRCQDW